MFKKYTTKKEFGQRIRERRKRLSMSQAELAKLVGVNQNCISDIETGKSWPTMEHAQGIASALKAEPGELLFSNRPISLKGVNDERRAAARGQNRNV